MKGTIDTSLTTAQYVETVDNIVERFFDEKGKYQPHWGRIGTLALFYGLFCKEDDEEAIDSGKLEELLNDDHFVMNYDACIKGENRDGFFDFYSAYQDAMQIVEYRKTAAGTVNEAVRFFIDKTGDLLKELTQGDKLEDLSKLASLISDGKLDRDALANAVIDGIVERAQTDEDTDDNVVPFVKKD